MSKYILTLALISLLTSPVFAGVLSLSFVNSSNKEIDSISALPGAASKDYAIQRNIDGVADKAGSTTVTLTSDYPDADIFIATRSAVSKAWFSLSQPVTTVITNTTSRRIFNIRSDQEIDFELSATSSGYIAKTVKVSIKVPPPPPPPAPKSAAKPTPIQTKVVSISQPVMAETIPNHEPTVENAIISAQDLPSLDIDQLTKDIAVPAVLSVENHRTGWDLITELFNYLRRTFFANI